MQSFHADDTAKGVNKSRLVDSMFTVSPTVGTHSTSKKMKASNGERGGGVMASHFPVFPLNQQRETQAHGTQEEAEGENSIDTGTNTTLTNMEDIVFLL